MFNKMDVWLYVYDLSGGICEAVTSGIPCLQEIRGIWHSSVVIDGKEFEFGPKGVSVTLQKDNLDKVEKKYLMGTTYLPLETIMSSIKHY